MAQARKGAKIQSKINMILYGDYFTGKSTLGIQMSMLKRPDGKPFRVLVIDAEQGSIDDYMGNLEEQGVNLENIYIVYTQSLEEVNYYIDLATKHHDLPELDDEGNELDSVVLDADGKPFHPDAIFVDGTSVLKLTSQQSLLNLAQRRAKIKANKNGLIGEEKSLAIEDAQLSMREWGALNYRGQSLVLNLAASGLHWCITCREKAETENRLIKGEMQSVNTGKFIPDSFKAVGYNAKTICRLYRDPEDPDIVKMFVEKDRTGVFNAGEIVEDPTMLAFQSMIDKKIGNNFVARNTMEQAVETEGKMYQKTLGIDDEEVSEVTAESLIATLRDLNKELNTTQRQKLPSTLEKNGLPKTPKGVTDVETLKAMVEVVKKMIG